MEAATDDELSYARSLGFLIRNMSMDSNLLEVDISVQGGDLAQEHIQALNALAPQIYKLGLKNTSLNDEQLAEIIELPNLLALNISNALITDQSFQQLQNFSALEVLNIVGTINMTEDGLSNFENGSNIKRIYSWGIGLVVIE